MIYHIENDALALAVSDSGAEIRSLVRKADGAELMWQADPAYWGRTSPILFPLVGNYRNRTTYYHGRAYSLGQHGFARDKTFTPEERSEDTLRFVLTDSEETHAVYPFAFRLHVGYDLSKDAVTVSWTVENPSQEETLYFSIGGHPAFLCDYSGGHLRFLKGGQTVAGPLVSGIIAPDGSGCLSERTKELPLERGRLPLTWSLFDEDALILEDRQADTVELLDADGQTRLAVSFDAPLFGVWSPAGKQAPFVCIEPWYGRCDRVDFSQQLAEREYGSRLAPGETFEASYVICAAPAADR